MIYTATGHRPSRLGLDYSADSNRKLVEFAAARLDELKPTKLITGGAQGWDQAVAHACFLLKIPYIVCVPFDGQERKWPIQAQDRYRRILKYAMKVEIVSHGSYSPSKFIIRDKRMVDLAKAEQGSVLALYDGLGKSGTAATVEYAQSLSVPVHNVWHLWTV